MMLHIQVEVVGKGLTANSRPIAIAPVHLYSTGPGTGARGVPGGGSAVLDMNPGSLTLGREPVEVGHPPFVVV